MLRSHIRFLALVTQNTAIIYMLSYGAYAFGVSVPSRISGIRVSAEQGHVRDQIAMGGAYLVGRGVKQDLKQAAFWYEKAAGSGDPEAQNQMGYFYQVGLGVPANEARAVHWFQLAASAGYLDAKVNLGVAYVWGTGVAADPGLAIQLFREAAEKGSAVGATYLGEMYQFGVRIPSDEAAARKWYERGAKLHNSLAAFRLGVLLAAGKGPQQDLLRAAGLFREAVSDGFVPAMHSLGVLLVNHAELNTAQADEALSLLNRSADAGTWKSSVVLGILARDGNLTPQDDRAAYLHFQIAIQQGGDAARKVVGPEMKTLASRLSPDQLVVIDNEAQTWTERHRIAFEILYKDRDHRSRFPGFGLMVAPAGSHAATLVPIKPS